MSQNPGTLPSPPVKRKSRLVEKMSTMAAILVINLAIFLFLGSYVVYRVLSAQQVDPLVFVKTKPVPPPPKPPAKGGEAARSLADPSTLIVPPSVVPPSMIVSTLPSNINFKAQISAISTSTLSSPSLAVPSGSGYASGTSGGGVSMSSPFGGSPTAGSSGLIGELYDLKQTPTGSPTPIAIAPPETLDGYDPNYQSFPATKEGMKVLRQYVQSWDQSILDQYYKAPVDLEASQIFIPTLRSEEATKAFQVADKVTARRWIAHYHGSILPPKGGRYRFLGFGDDFLVVRIDGHNVLDGSFPGENLDEKANVPDENIPGPDGHHLAVGKWVDFDAGVAVPIDVLIGEGPGGFSGFVLLIEEEGDTAEKGDYPVFQVASAPVPKWDRYPEVFTGKTLIFAAQPQ